MNKTILIIVILCCSDAFCQDSNSKRNNVFNAKSSSEAFKIEAEIIPGMIYIPPGEFVIGTDDGFDYESPARRVFVKGFYIDKYEVTNVQYKRFIDSAGHTPPKHWKNSKFSSGEDNYPVTNVSCFDSQAYAAWSGKRLPTEIEWEKSARGSDGRIYPWGNEWNRRYANVRPLIGFGKVRQVGNYPNGKSIYDVYDLCGNVWEWTDNWFEPYPGNMINNPNYGQKYKVIRGGSYRQSEVGRAGSGLNY